MELEWDKDEKESIINRKFKDECYNLPYPSMRSLYLKGRLYLRE